MKYQDYIRIASRKNADIMTRDEFARWASSGKSSTKQRRRQNAKRRTAKGMDHLQPAL